MKVFMIPSFRRTRFFPVVLLSLLVAACGGGSSPDAGNNQDNDGNGLPSPTAGSCSGSGEVVISGTAQFELVPAEVNATGAELDYASSRYQPIRNAPVSAICPDGSAAYSTGTTDGNGAFQLIVPENVDVALRVNAAIRSDRANFTVVDNTREQGVWSAEGEAFNSGTGSMTVDLRAPSGWDGSGYSGDRAAAPFAILDAVYTAMEKVLLADPAAAFPPLKLNWSPKNTSGCAGELVADYPYPDGCIGTSFFANFGGTAGRNIFILGEAGNDTDEYDRHVILHEWAHYYESAFARSDSIGGNHGGGDALDPRVAFSEGWGNAFAGIATDNPVYVDTMGSRQGGGFWIDVEDERETAAGWWNEASVQEIVYDLYDAPNDDPAALGFAPIHDVLMDGHRTTAAMTSLFSFIHFLKQHPAVDPAVVRAVVSAHDIAEITDEWGSGRGDALLGVNDNGSEFGAGYEAFVSPVHGNLVVAAGETSTVCTSNAVDPGSASEYNRLGVRRLLRFEPESAGRWRIVVAGESVESDPDFHVYLRGAEVTNRNGSPDVSGEDDSNASNPNTDGNPDGGPLGVESAIVALSSGTTYVIEVLDYVNADDDSSTGGERCLDITFEAL